MSGLMTEVTAMVPVLLDTTLKGSVLLLLIFGVAKLLRRAPAATRHQMWAAGLVALIALPVLTVSVPWRLEVLPTGVAAAVPSMVPSSEVAVVGPDLSAVGATLSTLGTPSGGELSATGAATASEAAATGDRAATATSAVAGASEAAAAGPGASWGWASALAALWLVGAALALLRLGVGWIAAWWIVRRAEPLTEDAWAGDLLRMTERLGLGRPVRLLRSPRVRLAFTTGLFRPVVVLPPDCLDWTAERRRAVLLHELAHVRRGDLLMHLLSRAACAVHWFNPLVWLAARRLRAESERACDDMVIRQGTKASDYAGHLLDMVRSAGRLRAPAVVLPMAQESEFEGRLLAILEPDAPRQSPSRVATAGIAAAIALSALPLAAMSPASTPAGPVELDGTVVESMDPADDQSSTTPDAIEPGPVAEAVAEPDAPARAANEPGPTPDDESESVDRPDAAPEELPAVAQESSRRAEVLSGLTAALEDAAKEVRKEAADALGDLQDTAAVAALARALASDEDPEVRATAAYSLGQLESRRAVPSLTRALREDAVPEVRNRAAWALGQIEDVSAVDALVAALGDEDAEVRNRAAWALGQIESPAAVPGLLVALRDPVPGVRERSAWALGQIESTEALDGLMGAIEDENADVRRYALWALYQIEDPRAQPAYLRALADPDPRVRVYAIRGLGDLEQLSAAPQALLDAASDENAEVRKYVAWALGEIEDPAAVPVLSRLLRDPVAEVRRYALRGLAEIGDDSAIQALVDALQDEDAAVRREAARALGRLGGGSDFLSF